MWALVVAGLPSTAAASIGDQPFKGEGQAGDGGPVQGAFYWLGTGDQPELGPRVLRALGVAERR